MSEVTATAKSVNLSPAHGNRAFDQWDQDFNGLLSPKEVRRQTSWPLIYVYHRRLGFSPPF